LRSIRYLDLADFLLIAEAVLGVDAGQLIHSARLDLAESALAAPAASFEAVEFYPSFTQKAAALCYHLVRNHPLLDGNKRVGYLCLVEFVERNGRVWDPPLADIPDGDETTSTIEGVAAGRVSQESLVLWIEERVSPRSCE
jgi:death on curing protein